jgi:hypothetical protein
MTERNVYKLLKQLSEPREGYPDGIICKRKGGVGRGFITEYQFVGLDSEPMEKAELRSSLSVTKGEWKAESKTERKDETRDSTIRKEQENDKTIEQKQHAYGALHDWLQIKETLKTKLPPDEFKHWVRPLLLLKPMGATLLLSLPPNKAMVSAAKNRRDMLQSLLLERGYDGFVLTHYPDEHQRERLRTEYPGFYEQMFGNKVPLRRAGARSPELVEQSDGRRHDQVERSP